MDYFLLIAGVVFILLGIAGCLLPILPGPPVSFLGLLALYYTKWGEFSSQLLLMLGIAAALVTLLDMLIPVWGTKKYGGTKAGIWGATIGLLAGLFFFPPFGIILGPFVGAFVGEMLRDNNSTKAWRSAVGSFVGFLLGTGLKLITSFVMAYYFFRQLV